MWIKKISTYLYGTEKLTTYEAYTRMLTTQILLSCTLHHMSTAVETGMIQYHYCIFITFYCILNILVCILPDDGKWLPKHVSGINKLYLYVFYMCKCSCKTREVQCNCMK
jgi:hypothetical protein